MAPLLTLAALVLSAPPAPAAEPLPPAEAARREALTRFGVGVLRARDDRPVEAVKQLEAAAKTDPAAAEPLRQLVALYVELSRDAAAVRTAESVLRIDPQDAETAHTLGKLLFDAKRFADAARVLRQADDSPRLADKPAKRLGVLRDLARVCDAAKDPAGAEDALRKAVAFVAAQREALLRTAFSSTADLDRETAVLHEQLGRALEAQKKFGEAEAAFTTAATLFADRTRANAPQAAARLAWNLSGVAADRGDTAAAVDYLLKFLALKPQNAEPYERLAELLARADRRAAVVPTLVQLAEQSPTIPAIRWVLAAETGRANPAQAEDPFREAARDTADPAFYKVAVRYYRDTNRPVELLALLDELYRSARVASDDENAQPNPAAGKKPVDPSAVARARAATAAVRADREAGRQLVNALGNAGPLSDDTWELLAALAERSGRPELAERAARQAWEAWAGEGRRRFGPGPAANDKAAPFFRLYRLLTQQRKWEEAIELCDASTRGRQWNFRSYRAVPLAELGRESEALAVVDEFLNVQNGNPFAGRLQRARVLNIVDRHRKAAEECRDLLKEFPAPDQVRQTRQVLADALNGQKDYAGAEAELRAVLEDDPDDVLALNNLGYNLADQGRKLDEAEEMVRRAIRLDRDARAGVGNPEGESGVYLDSLGWVEFRRGRLTDARQTLETAAALPDSGSDPVVWDHLGDVAFRQGDKARAREAWSKAVGLYDRSHMGRQLGRQDEAKRKLGLVP